MVELKTARMFQVAARGAAQIVDGTEEQIKAMDEFGRIIGIGFQIWDDVLDVKRGKSLKSFGSDIKEGKNSFIVVHALENLKGEDRQVFLGILGRHDASPEDVNRAVALMDKAGTIEYARDLALEYSERAKRLLDVFPASDANRTLEAIAEYMVKRSK